MKEELSPNNYRAWVEPLRPVALRDGLLALEGPQHVVDWASNRLGNLFRRQARVARLKGVEFRRPAYGTGQPGIARSGRPCCPGKHESLCFILRRFTRWQR